MGIKEQNVIQRMDKVEHRAEAGSGRVSNRCTKATLTWYYDIGKIDVDVEQDDETSETSIPERLRFSLQGAYPTRSERKGGGALTEVAFLCGMGTKFF